MSDYVIAKYIRLSLDDAISESLSIPNQRLLLDKHIEELDLPNATVMEFVDNGYTGTNLERPAVQEMLELVRCGRVNCIIVKDFSRFSRDAMESGYYIEQVFPLYQVRFIAIGEHYDSADYKDGTGGIDVAFRFLMHEYYSKDLSKKVRTALHVRMKNGEHIVAGAIYGYRKNNSGKWEADPEAAEVVRQIYELALQGLTTSQIRDKMFEAKYQTPREYSKIKRGKEITPKFMWSAQMIWRTLTNEQYTGSYVAGKHESSQVGTKYMKANDREKWIIIPDSHPAIVSKEDFATVQELIHNPKKFARSNHAPSSHSELLRERREKGELKSNIVPYGYAIAENGDWHVDEIAAKVIRDIFEMVLQGLSIRDICGKLYESKQPSPSEHFKLLLGKNIQPTFRWTELYIRELLKNEQYTGVRVTGKSFQSENGKRYHVPKSEWVKIPDKHPKIVDKATFDQVQEIRTQSRKNMQRQNNLLSGKVVCGCCGISMFYGTTTTFPTYRCYYTHADTQADCHKMKVTAHELDDAVMTVIKAKARLVLESDNLSELRKPKSDNHSTVNCETQIRQCEEQHQQFYEQFIQGEIDRDTFNTRKGECAEQIEKLKQRITFLKQAESDKQANQKIKSVAKEVLHEAATPKDIVNALVEKVLVFPNNKIEIVWKFTDFATEA